MIIPLRPILSGDDEFIFTVRASTGAQEMQLVDWCAAQKHVSLQMHFRAQGPSYPENSGRAEFRPLLLDRQPIRRSYVQQARDEIQVMNFSLLPHSSILEKDEDARRAAKQ